MFGYRTGTSFVSLLASPPFGLFSMQSLLFPARFFLSRLRRIIFETVIFFAEDVDFTAKFFKLLFLVADRANQTLFFNAHQRIVRQCHKILDNFYINGKSCALTPTLSHVPRAREFLGEH